MPVHTSLTVEVLDDRASGTVIISLNIAGNFMMMMMNNGQNNVGLGGITTIDLPVRLCYTSQGGFNTKISPIQWGTRAQSNIMLLGTV